MNYKLLIGNLSKYDSLVDYLEKNNIQYIIFDEMNPKDHINRSKNKNRKITYVEHNYFFDPYYYVNFIKSNGYQIDQVINFRDELSWVILENKINELLGLPFVKNEKTLNFLTHKSYQDAICKELSISTIPLSKNKIIVKKDAGSSGGNGFYITNFDNIKNFKNTFLQDYIEIEYTLAVQCYIDDNNNWYILNYHKLNYEDNCPIHSISPYFGVETKPIKDYISLLKSKIQLSTRLIFWQFVKEKNGSMFNMDFNCRPAGGFEAGSYDTDISNNNWLDYLIKKNIPKDITFTHSVEIFYKNKQTFGYTDYNRVKKPIHNFTYEVEKI